MTLILERREESGEAYKATQGAVKRSQSFYLEGSIVSGLLDKPTIKVEVRDEGSLGAIKIEQRRFNRETQIGMESSQTYLVYPGQEFSRRLNFPNGTVKSFKIVNKE